VGGGVPGAAAAHVDAPRGRASLLRPAPRRRVPRDAPVLSPIHTEFVEAEKATHYAATLTPAVNPRLRLLVHAASGRFALREREAGRNELVYEHAESDVWAAGGAGTRPREPRTRRANAARAWPDVKKTETFNLYGGPELDRKHRPGEARQGVAGAVP
jgi:hypothetical protein